MATVATHGPGVQSNSCCGIGGRISWAMRLTACCFLAKIRCKMESTTYAKVVRLETNFWKCFAPDGKTREKEMQKTLLAGLEEAVDKLGPLRKAAWKRRLKNSAARQRALEELAEDFRGSDCCAEMQLQAAFDGPQFTAETPLEIDLDKWTKIVEWIMQWLPKIVDMIRKWFNIAILFAAFGLLPSVAIAQNCPNGQCPIRPVRQPVATAAKVVGNVLHRTSERAMEARGRIIANVDARHRVYSRSRSTCGGMTRAATCGGTRMQGGACGGALAPVMTPASIVEPVQAPMPVPVTASPRWHNHDGLSRLDHARHVHLINTSGMTEQQASLAADHDHDRFGGHHAAIQSMRGASHTARYRRPLLPIWRR